ncbi:MAG TPA: antibiotic biosynthesis monooxygenase [Gaiellaceae bacterium]|nr:antibiotic biosynthesis monooxygenase [Gaiellaceae bacterium]
MIATVGIWLVREGREEEFVRRWQEVADGTVLEYADVTFRLLRDRENPRRFVGLGEGWRSAEQVEALRASPRYQDSMSSLWRLLESGELGTFELVAEVS